MKKLLLFALVFTMSIYFFLELGTNNDLALKLYGQQKIKWCWAASTQMVINYQKGYINDTLVQCEIVNKASNSTGCCDNLCTEDTACSEGMFVNDYLSHTFEPNGYTADSTYGFNRFNWGQITEQIDANLPFLVTEIHQNTSDDSRRKLWSNHAIVGYGYVETSSEKWIMFKDPWEMCKGCAYAITLNTLEKGGHNIGFTEFAIDPEDGYAAYPPVIFYNFRPINHEVPIPERVFSFLNTNMRATSRSLKKQFREFEHYEINSAKKIAQLSLNSFKSSASNKVLKALNLENLPSLKIDQLSDSLIKKVISVKSLKDNPTSLEKVFIQSNHSRKVVVYLVINGSRLSSVTLTQIDGSDFWRIDAISNCAWLPIAERIAKDEQLSKIDDFKSEKFKEIGQISLQNSYYQFYELQYGNERYYLPRKDYRNSVYNKFYTESDFLYLTRQLLIPNDILYHGPH